MALQTDVAGHKRKHSAGETTRELLMETAERLFAMDGVEGVTLREIQSAAGQSNASVIAYHFGSKAGLVRALVEHRYRRVDARRLELFEELKENGWTDDPRAVIWVVVRPLVESIEAGQMFVPFLARVSENPRAHKEFWPRHLEESSVDVLKELVSSTLDWMSDRARRGREVQLHNSVLNLLGEHARSRHPISPTQLSNYVDGWVGMLTAPSSDETLALMAADQELKATST